MSRPRLLLFQHNGNRSDSPHGDECFYYSYTFFSAFKSRSNDYHLSFRGLFRYVAMAPYPSLSDYATRSILAISTQSIAVLIIWTLLRVPNYAINRYFCVCSSTIEDPYGKGAHLYMEPAREVLVTTLDKTG